MAIAAENLVVSEAAPIAQEIGNPNLNRFAEIQLTIDALNLSGDVPEGIRNLILDNKMTAAWEAATGKKGVLSITHQHFDPAGDGFQAYGMPILPMLESGIADISWRKARALELEYAPEAQALITEETRRLIELEEEQSITAAVGATDFTPGSQYLFLSPFPEEMDAEVAQDLGYNAKDHTAMLRCHSIDAEGKKSIRQIKLSNSDLGTLAGVLRDFVDQDELAARAAEDERLLPFWQFCQGQSLSLTSPDLMVTHSLLAFPPDQTDPLLAFACAYDKALADQSESATHYFFGKQRDEAVDVSSYEKIYQWREEIESRCAPLIQALTGHDIHLARAIHAGDLLHFPDIVEKLQYYLELRDAEGDYILTPVQRAALAGCFSGSESRLTNQAATELSTMETIRTWSAISALTGHESAAAIFGREFVQRAQSLSAAEVISEFGRIDFDRKVLTAEQIWVACGFKLGGANKISLLSIRGDFEGLLFGDDEDADLSLNRENSIFICEHCHYFHAINARAGELVTHCRGCGAPAGCGKEAGPGEDIELAEEAAPSDESAL